MVVAAEWGTGQVLWSMMWFFLWLIWIWMLFMVFGDVFRSRDLSGWGKALWSIFVIVVPYVGVFTYLIARGHKMGQHAAEAAEQRDAAFRQHVENAAASSPADQLTKLSDLHSTGAIDDAEYERLKAKVLA